jgi:hypothetical protein
VNLPDPATFRRILTSIVVGALVGPLSAFPIAHEPGRPCQGVAQDRRKLSPPNDDQDVPAIEPAVTLGAIVSLRENEILVLSDAEPSPEQFSRLLRDRVTGDVANMAPRLLDLLREVAKGKDVVRIEVISGYRSWKLNEMLRKKGRNVAAHSQHSLGTAMDFRVEGMTSKQLADAIEKIGWKGGLAHYPGDTDRFVHADVGPHRRWRGR